MCCSPWAGSRNRATCAASRASTASRTRRSGIAKASASFPTTTSPRSSSAVGARRFPTEISSIRSGSVLGTHHGAIRYTVGQRKGLGVAAARPLYVTGIDARANTVTLGDEADLMFGRAHRRQLDLVGPRARHGGPARRGAAPRGRAHPLPPGRPGGPRAAGAAPRMRGGARARPRGGAPHRFRRAQRAVAPGQAVVLYDGDVCWAAGASSARRTPRPRAARGL